MLHYKLSTLAPRRKGTFVALPIIQPTNAVELAYRKALLVMLKRLVGALASEVIPVVEREYAKRARESKITGDVSSGDFEQLKTLALALARGVGRTVDNILKLEAKRHTKTFMATAKRALGIDISSVVRDEDLGDYMEAASARSAGLITNMAESFIARIQNTVTSAMIAGKPVTELKKELKADFGMSERRAKLIARDQTAKFNSDLNRIRHEQAGIEEYIWQTAADERVRSRHRSLQGRQYKYGESTGAEGGLPPGQPVQCRCVAQAIVEF